MISLRRATIPEEVELIIKTPEIFKRIAEDGVSRDTYKIPMDACFMLILKDEDVIGVWCLHPENKTTVQIHCNILQEHRAHGKEAALLILKFFVNEMPKNYKKLNTEIPFSYPSVYHFTRKWLKDEGVNRQSIMKEGKLVDQWRLGATRQEIEEIVWAS